MFFSTFGSNTFIFLVSKHIGFWHGSPVILIDHHQFESDETWARFERDTNVYRWRAIKDLIEFDVSVFFLCERDSDMHWWRLQR